MIIYKITNNVNGKIYIGQTIKDLNFRMIQHKSKARTNDIKDCFAIHRAMKKYGIDNFSWEVICVCETLEELYEKEAYYVESYDSMNPSKGYNMIKGGMPTPRFSGEDHPMYGRKHTEESKRKMSETKKANYTGKTLSSEHKENISKSHSKTWQVTTPDGEVLIVKNLFQWCKDIGISGTAIKRPKGTQGYKAVRLD